MTFEVEQGRPVVISLEGSALGGPEGMAFSGALNEALDAEKGADVVVDLAKVDIMNSSGLGMLVAASRSVKGAGGTLALAGANEALQKLLKMTRLDTVFAQHETREDAVESLRSR